MSRSAAFVTWFRSAAPYIHAFRGKTFVIAFGGEFVQRKRFLEFVHDVNLLESLGVRLVLVHGTRPQVEAKLKAWDHRSAFVGGARVTDTRTLVAVKEAAGAVRADIEALLSLGLADSPMAGSRIRVAGGNSIAAQPIGVIDGVDLQHTGEVRKIDAEQIRRRLDGDEIVLLSPVGYSPTGEIFNLALGDVAASVAVALAADKLLFLVDGPGVMSRQGGLLTEVTAREAESLSGGVKQTEDIKRYLPFAVRACKAGVTRCHFIDYNVDGALLLEFFTRTGIGTMVTREPLETLRAAEGADIAGIVRLIEPLEEEGILVRRDRERLVHEIGNFTVLEHDGRIVGCVALYPFSPQRAGELACLAVDPDYRKHGRGERLMRHVEHTAKARGLSRLFVLSTRTAHWFIERGYAQGDVQALPHERRELYNFQRRSKVFWKRLK